MRCVARGAGGRFVGRERAHEPVVHGLKALDLDGAGRAAAACTHAKTISDGSITRAQNLRAALSSLRTLTFLVDAVRDLAAIEQADESAALEAQQAAQQQEQETAEMRRSLAVKLANLAREPIETAPPVETPVTGVRIRLLSD